MTETTLAYAKINISLDVVSKMNDGYHYMKMVMQTVGLCDEITVECGPGEGISIEPGLPYLPADGRNIAAKAALAFYNHTGISGFHTHIAIKKDIPVCAGLGGGSADGAAVLRLLDRMHKTQLGFRELETIGSTIGSDVPFCITGGTVLAEGKGDILTALPPVPRCHIVICKPPFANSTPELFKRMRCEKIRARPDTAGIITALEKGSLCDVARRMYNVFEDILPRGTRDIADIKYTMLDSGALGAVMSGTGPAVFGVFDNAANASVTHKRLKALYSECYLTETAAAIG